MNLSEFETMQPCYKAVIKEEWSKLPLHLSDKAKIFFPMTTTRDTAVHLAVYSGEEEPTRGLLAAISDINEDVFWTNDSGNTPLHEAASVGNLAAAKLLVQYNKTDLLSLNGYGETPLFRAARCGHLDIVRFFLEDCEDFYARAPLNWTRGNETNIGSGTPIVHAAIQSQNFEVVLKLVDFNKSLLQMIDIEGKTGLHLLANMPLAFKSGTPMPFVPKLVYYLLPNEDIYKYKFSKFGSLDNDDSEISNTKQDNHEDLEAGSKPNNPPPPRTPRNTNRLLYFLFCFICLFWKFIMKGWPQVKQLYEKKRQHKLALTITEMLAQIDYSWRDSKSTLETQLIDDTGVRRSFPRDQGGEIPVFEIQAVPLPTQADDGKNIGEDIEYDDHHETPLLLAAANGIIEIVEKIIEAHPQAVDYITSKQRNLLHIAIAHRQNNIFDWLQKRKLIMSRLATRIDELGFTALHHVGITKFYRGGTQHGPALQLQQELKWFQRVENAIPTLYSMHHSKKKWTAREYFRKTHSQMLDDAKEWLKKTSESCSAVAVLVATVVFAAAYTVPGGLNDKTGSPVLLNQPIFLVFTVMDIVALATSLSSVVLFLSVLTSSFKMEDFLQNLPLKLSFGFQLLFFSVATTMFAFALTIVLTVKSEHKWTVTLLYMATFFPVSMFIIIQLPLYVELVTNILSYRDKVSRFLPMGFITPFFKVPASKFVRKRN